MATSSCTNVKRIVLVCATALLIAVLTAHAQARCGKHTYNGFVKDFERARDTIAAQPAQAHAELVDIQKHASECLQEEPNRSVRFKITLFQTGLQAYIGAADAASGNLPRGKSTAEAAMQSAKALLAQNQNDVEKKKLVEELLAQLARPLDLIARMEHPNAATSSAPSEKVTPPPLP